VARRSAGLFVPDVAGRKGKLALAGLMAVAMTIAVTRFRRTLD
jgi:hypothetical protein